MTTRRTSTSRVRACGARGTTSGAPSAAPCSTSTGPTSRWPVSPRSGPSRSRSMAVEPSVWRKGATPGDALPAGATAVCRLFRFHCHCSGSIVVPPACSSVVRIRADSGRRGGYADGGTARVGRQRRGVARTRRTWCRFPEGVHRTGGAAPSARLREPGSSSRVIGSSSTSAPPFPEPAKKGGQLNSWSSDRRPAAGSPRTDAQTSSMRPYRPA